MLSTLYVSGMSLRLPLFPLGIVLFPGGLLPLHIFEPRYRRLLDDIVEGDRRFGLVLPGIGREAPAVGAVGTIAELRVTFNPLVVWVWAGGALMAIGGLIVMWPQAERRRRAQAGYVTVLKPAESGEPAVAAV